MKKTFILLAFIIMSGVVLAQLNQLKTNENGTKAVIDTLHYDGNNNDGIGTGGAGTFEVYAFFSASQLATYSAAGNTILSIDIYIKGVNKVAATTVKLRATQTTTSYSQAFTPIEGWNNVVLTTPFPIPVTDLYIGYECVVLTGGFPLGCDAGPVNTNGNWIVYGGSWGHLTDLNAAMTYNWNIRARVDGAAAPSSDAKLSALLVNGVSVSGFSPTVYSYNVVYPFGTTALPVVTATTNFAGATKAITNITAFPGAASVVVTAQDGTTIFTYTINFSVAAPSTDAKLSDLLVNGTTVPGFSPTVYTYNVVYPYGTTALPIVTAISNFSGATKVITNISALPGAATVVVTAQDGTTTLTYIINFSVAAPSIDAKLSNLLVNGTTVPGFSPTGYSYNFILPYGTIIMPVVTAVLNDVNASKVINNVSSLPGSATVIVTAQDEVTMSTYTINFTIALSIDYVELNYLGPYPSPTSGKIKIPCNNEGEITICDMAGKVIFKSKISPEFNEFNLIGNDKGTYLVQTSIKGQIFKYKILLQ